MSESQLAPPRRWLSLHIALGVIIGLLALPAVCAALLMIGAFLKGFLGV